MQPTATEFTVDGHRWFDVDFTPAAHRDDQTIVAQVSINLADEEHLTPDQLSHDPDPVTRVLLTRHRMRGLSYFTWGDCEFYGELRPVLAHLGALAVQAGVLTPTEWVEFALEQEIDLL